MRHRFEHGAPAGPLLGLGVRECLMQWFRFSKLPVFRANNDLGRADNDAIAGQRMSDHAAISPAKTNFRNHFEKREGMKIGRMFKSPMTLMMIVSMGAMFLLPKMMANMDPEQLKVKAWKLSAAHGASATALLCVVCCSSVCVPASASVQLRRRSLSCLYKGIPRTARCRVVQWCTTEVLT